MGYSTQTPSNYVFDSFFTFSIQTVRFYEVEADESKPSELKSKFDHRAAVLACCFSDGTHAYSGGLDTSVRESVVLYVTMKHPSNRSSPQIRFGNRKDQSPRLSHQDCL